MRCKACNVLLSDKETSRRGVVLGDYLDLCDGCFSPIADEVSTTFNPKFLDSEDEAIFWDESNEDQGV